MKRSAVCVLNRGPAASSSTTLRAVNTFCDHICVLCSTIKSSLQTTAKNVLTICLVAASTADIVVTRLPSFCSITVTMSTDRTVKVFLKGFNTICAFQNQTKQPYGEGIATFFDIVYFLAFISGLKKRVTSRRQQSSS